MNRSPNHNSREDQAIDMLILHYTGMQTADAALERLCDPAAAVSAHYLIDEDGTVVDLVAEDHRAWHAGVSFWRGETNINSRSIGIELVNPGHEWGYRMFPEQQIAALIDLCTGILSRHDIPARNIVGHSDVAPTRKEDPGELFPWSHLASRDIGLWADDIGAAPVADGDVIEVLQGIGYDTTDEAAAVRAFQRHFCPGRLDGVADIETRATLAALRNML